MVYGNRILSPWGYFWACDIKFVIVILFYFFFVRKLYGEPNEGCMIFFPQKLDKQTEVISEYIIKTHTLRNPGGLK